MNFNLGAAFHFPKISGVWLMSSEPWFWLTNQPMSELLIAVVSFIVESNELADGKTHYSLLTAMEVQICVRPFQEIKLLIFHL